jgi:selenide,water dikinase
MDQVMPAILAAPPTRRKPARLGEMQSRVPVATDLVLLGAGHAHVEVLRRFAMRPEPGVRLTLIGREPETPYTGMLPGLIRGEYSFDQAHIDLAPIAAAAGARLILAEATAIRLAERRITVTGRPDVPFDLLSIDVGGEPAMPTGSGVPVKPIGQFLARLAALEAELRPGARLAVVGGGAGGTELALALARRYRERARIVLVADAAEPLAGAPSFARSIARTALVDAGVELVCGVQAGALANGRLALSDGSFLEAATALWATGVVGPAFLAASGLACDEVGCIRVNASLRSISHGFVFAAGDCATIEHGARPKAGVWAVRAGAPLRPRPELAILAASVERTGHRWSRRWTCSGVAQRDSGVRLGSVALEGLDRPALDAHVPGTDGANAGR